MAVSAGIASKSIATPSKVETMSQATLEHVSSRARTAAVVATVAAAAAAATVGGALVQGGDVGGEVHGRTATGIDRAEPPALELALVDRDDAEARALRAAERAYEEGDAAAAARRFAAVLEENPASVEAAVGSAIADDPGETVDRLEELVQGHPTSGVARLNLGLALLATGENDAALTQWREAERRDPDSPAALRAEDLRNPDSPPGRPVFILRGFPRDLAGVPAARRLDSLRARARRGGGADWLLYGSGLEAVGHRVSAQRAYDRALALDRGSLEASVAAAVSRFDKDEPARAFSRLGPLAPRNPRSALVRFHLGLLLLWLPNVDEARRQLSRARTEGGFYGRQAARILERLDEAQ